MLLWKTINYCLLIYYSLLGSILYSWKKVYYKLPLSISLLKNLEAKLTAVYHERHQAQYLISAGCDSFDDSRVWKSAIALAEACETRSIYHGHFSSILPWMNHCEFQIYHWICMCIQYKYIILTVTRFTDIFYVVEK